jgi:hypothetical protein
VTSDLQAAEKERIASRQKYRRQALQPHHSHRSRAHQHQHHGNGDEDKHHNIDNGVAMARVGAASVGADDGAQSRTAQPPSPQELKMGWKPSFWTKNKRWADSKHLCFIITCWASFHLLVDLGTAHLLKGQPSAWSACETSDALKLRNICLVCHGIIMIPQLIVLALVVWRLRRHERDGYGLHSEVDACLFANSDSLIDNEMDDDVFSLNSRVPVFSHFP